MYRATKKSGRPRHNRSEFHAALRSIGQNACSDITEEDSGAMNHSSSMNASCNHSNVSQNMHNKRISIAPSLEMLPLVSAKIPGNVAVTQPYNKQSERKCAASQTSEESVNEGVEYHRTDTEYIVRSR